MDRGACQHEIPKVDVCIVTWNNGDLTSRTLRRLIDEDQTCDLRILVRDNASTDDTVSSIRSRVPEAEVDAGEENVGFAAGVNTLIERSSSPWLMLLNPDASPHSGAIASLVASAEEHPRAAAVAPRLQNPDGTLQHSTYRFPSIGLAFASGLSLNLIGQRRAEELLLHGAWRHDRARQIDWAIGAALLIRRQAVENVGGFDELFFMYAEDLDWCWRARSRGWEIWYEPRAIVTHIGNVSGKQRYGAQRERMHISNALIFYRRHHSLSSTALWWALGFISALVRWAIAALNGQSGRAAWWRRVISAHVHALRSVRGSAQN